MANKLSYDLEKLLEKADGDSALVQRRTADVVGMRRGDFLDFLERVRELEKIARLVPKQDVADLRAVVEAAKMRADETASIIATALERMDRASHLEGEGKEE